jgi:hypothetical protein
MDTYPHIESSEVESSEPPSSTPTNNPDPPWYVRLWKRTTPLEHPVAWLAIAGSALVLTAAITSTTAKWESVSIPQRLGGMVALHLLILLLGERFRRSIPKSAQALAHLGAALFVPTGISAVAAGGGSWRSCILFGGFVGIGILELQSRRWNSRWMQGLQVGAAALAAAGLAAITHVPIGIFISALAVGALALGTVTVGAFTFRRDVESFSLAVIATLSPIMALVARTKFGSGTIAELGANGYPLAIGAPVAGVLSAFVFVSIANQYAHFRTRLLGCALVSVVGGGIIGISYAHPSALVRSTFVPVALIALQICLLSGVLNRFGSKNTEVRKNLGKATEVLELVLVLMSFARGLGAFTTTRPSIALALTAIGLGLGALRKDRVVNPTMVPFGLAVLHASGAIALETHSVWFMVWPVLATGAAVSVRKNLRPLQLAIAIAAPIAFVGNLVDGNVATTTIQLLLLTLGVTAFGISASLRRNVNALDIAGVLLLLGATYTAGHPLTSSLALIGVGVAVAIQGVLHRHQTMKLVGALISSMGALYAIDLLPNRGYLKADFIVAFILAGSAAIERWARGRNPIPGPEFAIPTFGAVAYLLLTTWITGSGNRIAAAIILGTIAIAFGVIRKMPPVALGGAVAVSGGAVIGTWDQLGSMPTWGWLLIGGLSLLGLGVWVERRRTATIGQ